MTQSRPIGYGGTARSRRYLDDPDPRDERRSRELEQRRNERDRDDDRDSRYSGSRDSRYGRRERRSVIGGYSRAVSQSQNEGGRSYRYQRAGQSIEERESLIPKLDGDNGEKNRITDAYLLADSSMGEVLSEIERRVGTIGNIIEDCFDLFTRPPNSKRPDPVFSEFISDLRSDGYIYALNVVPYILYGMIAKIADHKLKYDTRLSGEEFVIFLKYITMRVLILEFGNWLSGMKDGWKIARDLTRGALVKLDERDDIIDMFVNTVPTVMNYCGVEEIFVSPWKKGLLDSLSRSAPSRSPTFDEYISYAGYDFPDIRTPQVKSNDLEAPIHKSSDWDQSGWDAWACTSGKGTRSVHGEIIDNGRHLKVSPVEFNDNWSTSSFGAEEKESPEIIEEKIVTLKNIHEYDLSEVDYNRWFKEVPGHLGTYVIHPDDFAVISALLINKGKNEDYCKNRQHCVAYRMPVVELDWLTREYRYVTVPITGNEEISMILTNPELVIPKLEERTEEEEIEEYRAYTASLAEAEERRKLEENNPNEAKELTEQPTVIYANRSFMFEQRKRLNSTIDVLNTTAEKKCGKQPTAVVLPFTDYKDISFNGLSYDTIAFSLPFLIAGNPFEFTLQEFIYKTKSVFESRIANSSNAKAWMELQEVVELQIVTALNRWLTEERFYSPELGEKGHLSLKNKEVFEGAIDLLNSLEENDMPSYRVLANLRKCDFLVSHLQFFGTKEDVAYFAEQNTRDVDEDVKEELKDTIKNKTILASANGMLVCLNEAYPLDGNKMRVFERSMNPEILHIVDSARQRAFKYFDRKVPVYIVFDKDVGKTVWAVTYSGFDANKITLTPLEDYQSIALQRTMYSDRVVQ